MELAATVIEWTQRIPIEWTFTFTHAILSTFFYCHILYLLHEFIQVCILLSPFLNGICISELYNRRLLSDPIRTGLPDRYSRVPTFLSDFCQCVAGDIDHGSH
jgi:hypothetical protein